MYCGTVSYLFLLYEHMDCNRLSMLVRAEKSVSDVSCYFLINSMGSSLKRYASWIVKRIIGTVVSKSKLSI